MLLLSRLRRAVRKVKLLLHFDVHRWRIATMMIGGRSFDRNRRLSFNERQGLACATEEYYYSASEDSCSNSGHLQRSTSYPLDQDSDIDHKAEMFIANFRRQLEMERQISLEVRYYNGNSFDWRSP